MMKIILLIGVLVSVLACEDLDTLSRELAREGLPFDEVTCTDLVQEIENAATDELVRVADTREVGRSLSEIRCKATAITAYSGDWDLDITLQIFPDGDNIIRVSAYDGWGGV